MSSFTETLAEMTAVADAYCQLIDRTGRSPGNWLEMLYEIMPRLHAAVTALNSYDTGDAPLDGVDLDERFELYSRLRKTLGERDSYWLEFDSAPEEIHMSGSLADDLTDIYFDLLHGLELVDEATQGCTGMAVDLPLALGTAPRGCRTPSLCTQGAESAGTGQGILNHG